MHNRNTIDIYIEIIDEILGTYALRNSYLNTSYNIVTPEGIHLASFVVQNPGQPAVEGAGLEFQSIANALLINAEMRNIDVLFY